MSGKRTPADQHFTPTRTESSLIDIVDFPEIRQLTSSRRRSSCSENDEDTSFSDEEIASASYSTGKPGQDKVSDSENEGCGRRLDLTIQTNVEAAAALPHVDETEQAEAAKEKPVTWVSLPRKDQLAVLTLARLSEPLTQTSLSSYIFYQLRSFDNSLPDSTIAYQAGILHAAFPGAQFLTAIAWGWFADAEYGGRKRAITIGLLGTMISIIGYGFSHSFAVALFFRCLAGVLNGNIGVMRTMISEIIKEKKFQSRAFLLLPMSFNIGVIIGPILGEPAFPQDNHIILTQGRRYIG